jgi:hypothetical protein
MKYTAAHFDAIIASAAPIEQINGQWIPASPSKRIGTVPYEGGHDTPVVYPSRYEIGLEPNALYADALPELDELVTSFTSHVELALDREEFDNTLKHEGQHADIIRQLGGSVVFSLRLFANKEAGRTFWIPTSDIYDLTTTKIGYALILTYPEEPSATDNHLIRQLGYRDVRHVGDVAAASGLPGPLSDPHRKLDC